MTFALTKFKSYGIEADEALNKRDVQIAVFNITAANTDVDLDIGDYSGTFWTAVGAAMPGALKSVKDIQTQADSFLGVRGTSIAGYVQVDASRGTLATYTSAASAGGAASEAMTVTGLLSTDTVLAVTPAVASTSANTIYSAISSAITGGAASVTATVAGILKTDTVLSVTQQTNNANSKQIVSYESAPSTDGQLAVVYTADPGNSGKVNVVWARAGGNPITAYGTLINNGLTVTWAKDPGAGAKVQVTVSRTTTAVDDGTYELAMDSTNTQLPNILFLSGNAPTAYVLVLQWVLKDNALPVQYAA